MTADFHSLLPCWSLRMESLCDHDPRLTFPNAVVKKCAFTATKGLRFPTFGANSLIAYSFENSTSTNSTSTEARGSKVVPFLDLLITAISYSRVKGEPKLIRCCPGGSISVLYFLLRQLGKTPQVTLSVAKGLRDPASIASNWTQGFE